MAAGQAVAAAGQVEIALTPLFETPALPTFANYETFARGAGDVNADGAADIIVRTGGDPDGAGTVQVFSGADGSTLHTFTGNPYPFGYAIMVDGAGDINGDGYADIVIASRELVQSPSRWLSQADFFSGFDGSLIYTLMTVDPDGFRPGDHFGNSFAALGDIDGDGRDDFAVGGSNSHAPELQSGRILVYSGADGSVIHDISGEARMDFLGIRLAAAGDTDNDGVTDIIAASFVGAAARVYSGATGQVLLTLPEMRVTAIGNAVAGVGDVNSDGHDDVALGSHHDLSPGHVWVYSGATGELLHDVLGTVGPEGVGWFGQALSAAGDVDADGHDDLLVYERLRPIRSLPEAEVWVHIVSGSSGAIVRSLFFGDETTSGFACSVDAIGDANGDGVADLLVADVPFDDLGFGGPAVGRVVVLSPAVQLGCLADTNGDGMLTPADFNAWTLAFNNQSPACNQNADGLCTPADFNAWIVNYNAGCP